MRNPKISIVTVCYNAENTIEMTIQSVINQTYENVEYIIIDGASKDGTVDIIKKYDHRITKWISEPDKGIYDAMNKSFNYATGDWIFFLNSDDFLYSDEIISQVVSHLLYNNAIYYGNVLMIPQNEVKRMRYNKYRLGMGNICHQSIFYPSIVFKKYSYNTAYRLYADWFLNILCMSDKEIKFYYLDMIICKYSTTGVSNTSYDDLFWSNYYHILTRYLGLDVSLYVRIRRFLHKKKEILISKF